MWLTSLPELTHANVVVAKQAKDMMCIFFEVYTESAARIPLRSKFRTRCFWRCVRLMRKRMNSASVARLADDLASTFHRVGTAHHGTPTGFELAALDEDS